MQKNRDSPNNSNFRPKSVQSGIKLSVAAKNFLGFLAEVDRYVEHLSATPAINNAIRRYETLWLPLAASYGLVGPPIDVHWIWCVHMLSPTSYKQDCIAFTNKLIDHRCLPLKELQKAREASRKIWVSKYPDEPFDFDPNSSANLDLISYSSRLSQNLRESIRKHLTFHYQVSLPHFQDMRYLEESVMRYKKFVFLQLQNPDHVMVPLIDITLIWHSHKVHPSVYSKDTKSSIDKIIIKHSAMPDLLWIQNSPASLETTADMWNIVFKEKYVKAGSQYRGQSVKGRLYDLNLADAYFMSTKSAQIQIKSVTIEPHPKLDKYIIQFTNPLVALQPFSNYMAKLKSPEKCWPYKPGQKYVANTSLITGTVDAFTMEVVDRRGLFCANNAILTSRKICLLDSIENFLGTESQTLEMNIDIGKEKDASLGQVKLMLSLHPPERHATRLKLVIGENALLRVSVTEPFFWGATNTADMTNSISSNATTECYFLSHSIMNHIRKEVLTVRIIHSISIEKSVIQVLYQNQIVALSETIGSEQLPTPNSTHNNEILVLDPLKSERAIIIKDNEGDWGFIIGRWDQVSPNRTSSRTNDSHNMLQYDTEDFSKFYIRSHWLRGERKIQYSHIPDSMNSWSVVLNDVSFDLATGEIHISRQCKDIAQSVCLAFSCAVLLALCKPNNPESGSVASNSPEIKPPSETFNVSIYLPPNTEIIRIPPLNDHFLKKKDSTHFASTFQDPSRLLMCISVGINFKEYLPSVQNLKHRHSIRVTDSESNICQDNIDE